MFRHPYQDIQSERLLLVVLEEKPDFQSEYRHIRATVIRRAVPHLLTPIIEEGDVQTVQTWNDDYPAKCSGYRVASYVFSKPGTPTFVDDMQLRGQLDVKPNALRNGRPYGNSIRFTPYLVDQNTSRAILDFYNKFNKFVDKHGLTRQDDDFYVALNHLAQFLKITKVVFMDKGVRHCSLSETHCFEEVDIAFAKVHIDNLLAPFLQAETN